jgi:hypothetical protein
MCFRGAAGQYSGTVGILGEGLKENGAKQDKEGRKGDLLRRIKQKMAPAGTGSKCCAPVRRPYSKPCIVSALYMHLEISGPQ